MDEAKLLSCLARPLPLRCFKAIDSTNRYAKEWARQDAPPFALVAADEQTQGRGRLGRSFFSPQGGLYMSLILDTLARQPGEVTTLAAVAALRAVRGLTGLTLHIKWVNDLLLDGRKVGGILAEGVGLPGGVSRIVLGIGINTGEAGFPDGLARSAGTLHRAAQAPIERERLCAAIAEEVLQGLPLKSAHMAQYRAHCITLGKELRFTLDGAQRTGTALDILDSGALSIGTDTGVVTLSAGEAGVRMADGSYI